MVEMGHRNHDNRTTVGHMRLTNVPPTCDRRCEQRLQVSSGVQEGHRACSSLHPRSSLVSASMIVYLRITPAIVVLSIWYPEVDAAFGRQDRRKD